MYENRVYREYMLHTEMRNFIVKLCETELFIQIPNDYFNEEFIGYCWQTVAQNRKWLEKYIKRNPEYKCSMSPVLLDEDAPYITRLMDIAARRAGVGPMATVAGAFCQILGDKIKEKYQIRNLTIENGGDVYVYSEEDIVALIWLGRDSIFSDCKIRISKKYSPVGICTSSGVHGHSYSQGYADSVTIVSKDVVIADALATAFCNEIRCKEDISKVLKQIQEYSEIIGAIVIYEDSLGICGNIELVK